MNPIKAFKLWRLYSKFETIIKEKVPMKIKIPQLLHLLTDLFGILPIPVYAHNWISQAANVDWYIAIVAVSIVLHAIFPSIFGEASDADKSATGLDKLGMILAIISLGLFAGPALHAQETASSTTSTSISAEAETVGFYSAKDRAWHVAPVTSEVAKVAKFGKNGQHLLYATGSQEILSDFDWDIYYGGLRFQPDISTFLKNHTVLSSDSIKIFLEGQVGNAVDTSATTSQNHVAQRYGLGLTYNFTGSLVAKTVTFHYSRIGAYNNAEITSGIAYIFGGNK